jgi:predicted AAA+ superfamily ATPase
MLGLIRLHALLLVYHTMLVKRLLKLRGNVKRHRQQHARVDARQKSATLLNMDAIVILAISTVVPRKGLASMVLITYG